MFQDQVSGGGRDGVGVHSMFTSPLIVPPVETCRLLLASVCRKKTETDQNVVNFLLEMLDVGFLFVYSRTIKTFRCDPFLVGFALAVLWSIVIAVINHLMVFL